MNRTKSILAAGGAALAATLIISGVALAEATPTQPQPNGAAWGYGRMMGQHAPGIFGTVSAVSGNTITVTGKGWSQSAQSATYTVDASSATVTKNGSSAAIGDIAVGDTVLIQGTISGTSVSATAIRDGKPQGAGEWGERGGRAGANAALSQIQGDGQPLIAGIVSSVSGHTLTVSTKAGPSYTVDATNAKIVKGSGTETVSDIAVGDSVLVQGTVNGSSVTATSIVDQSAMPEANAGTNTQAGNPIRGFFGLIGGFFSRLFGFF